MLDTYSEETPTSLSHTLLLGFGLTGAGGDGCDRIEVVAWQFTTDRVSGNTQKSFDIKQTYRAKLVNGSPTLCN